MRLVEVVVLDDGGDQALKAVALGREGAGDLRSKQVEFVIKAQTGSGEDNLGADLRRDGQLVPREPELPQQSRQRTALGALGREIRQGVQADVVVAATQAVEGIQPADR